MRPCSQQSKAQFSRIVAKPLIACTMFGAWNLSWTVMHPVFFLQFAGFFPQKKSGKLRGKSGIFQKKSRKDTCFWVQRLWPAWKRQHSSKLLSLNATLWMQTLQLCGWVNAAWMWLHAYCMSLWKCFSHMLRLLVMLVYWGSWHFCSNFIKLSNLLDSVMCYLAMYAIKQKFQAAIKAEKKLEMSSQVFNDIEKMKWVASLNPTLLVTSRCNYMLVALGSLVVWHGMLFPNKSG